MIGIISFVVGAIVYTLCRAIFFELLLNRFLRDRLWSPNPGFCWKWIDILVGKQNNTEILALLKRFKSDNKSFLDFLDMRFGWVNVQIQTIVLLIWFWFISCAQTPWRAWSLSYKGCILLILIFYFLGTLRQCRTLWKMEVEITKEL